MKHSFQLTIISFCLLSISQFAISQDSTDSFIRIVGHEQVSVSSLERARGVMGKKYIDVNVRLLRAGSKVQNKEVAVQKPTGDGALMQLPDGTYVTLITNRLQSFVKGVETYTGRVKDLESSFFTLSIEDEKVFGQVSIDFMAYDIKYDKVSSSHLLTEIDQSRVPKDTPDPGGAAFSTAIQSIAGPLQMSSSVNGTVRILVLYGSDVANINTLASNIISEMNESFFDDGMDPDFHVTLADLRQLNSDLDGLCKETIREDMKDETSPFSNIETWREDEHADVVLTIATTDSSVTGCTLTGDYGRIGGIAYMLDSATPYAVTMDTYAIGDLTALHEIGHVLGGGHENWSVATLQTVSPDSEPYSRGYISNTGDWQTLMGAYDASCEFSETLPNLDCVRILRWSDPTESYANETRGVTYVNDTQVPFSADMKSALEIQMPIVAAFESYPDSVPGIPGQFQIIRMFCFGSNFASWQSTTNAENYQLLRSYASDFSNPEVIYFGPDTSLGVTAGQQQPLYLKVRACNGSGCGDLSAQKTASYYNGCL